MFSVLLTLLLSSSVTAEQLLYSAPPADNGGNVGNFDTRSSFGSVQSVSGGCGPEETRNAIGKCVRARITRNLFLFAAPPAQQIPVGPSPTLPDPKVHYNFVFIRSPQSNGGMKPIIVPPPQQRTLVYVLSKRPGALDREVIEVPSEPIQPEVYFVNYGPGDNTELPGGISLQEALSQSAQQGQVIDGGSSGGNDGSYQGGNIIGIDQTDIDNSVIDIDIRRGQAPISEPITRIVNSGNTVLNLGSSGNQPSYQGQTIQLSESFGTSFPNIDLGGGNSQSYGNQEVTVIGNAQPINDISFDLDLRSGHTIGGNEVITDDLLISSLTSDLFVNDDSLIIPAPVLISPPSSIYSNPQI